MKDNLSFLIQQLLKKSSIVMDFDELSFQIQSHPSYPSLHAVTGVLSHFNIGNVAVQVPITIETLVQLPDCFLAEIKKDTINDFVILNKINDGYQLVLDNKTIKNVSETEFLEQFTGILVAVEKDKTLEKLKTKTKSKDYTKMLASIAVMFFVFSFYYFKPSLIVGLHFSLSIFGVAISYLIIQQDLGFSSKIGDKICSQNSKTTNCDAILKSKRATLYNNIKLSDVSIIYFIALSIASFLLLLGNATYSYTFGISLLSTPIIFYSIYYQYAIAKNWCLLCLIVVAVLTFQVALSIITIKEQIDFTKPYLSLILMLLVFISTSTIWLFTISKLKEENKFKLLKIESTKFKRNYIVFKSLLLQNKPVNTTIIDTNEIVFGNKNSPLKLLVITNPFCGFCKDTHYLVENILNKHSEQMSITIRFNINEVNKESELLTVTSKLLEIYNLEGELQCLKAMHDLYNKMNIKKWFALYGTCRQPLIYNQVLLKERNWCITNEINFTPELLLSGMTYPNEYEIEDLLYFIEELYENSTNTLKLKTA